MTPARQQRKKYRVRGEHCRRAGALRPACPHPRRRPNALWSTGIPDWRSTALTRWPSLPMATRSSATAISNCATPGPFGGSSTAATGPPLQSGPTSTCRNMAATIRLAWPGALAVPGNPQLWVIVGERLFLFYDGAQRGKFLSNPARFLATSERRWPDVRNSLDP